MYNAGAKYYAEGAYSWVMPESLTNKQFPSWGNPIGEMLVEDAKAALRARFSDTFSIHVELVWDPPWDPSMMTEAAKLQLGLM